MAQSPDAATLQARFMQGFALHQQGKLADAERIYTEVLQRQPNHFDALHLLGIIAAQTRRTERAVELIRKAIALNASIADVHINLGNALMDLRRPGDALASFDKAIALEPNHFETHYLRGNALLTLKRPKDALASFDRAIALRPGYAEAHGNRGIALMDLLRLDLALASYDKAIALKPNYVEAHNNRGAVLLDLKRPGDALASYDRAIALMPGYAEAHYNRGVALKDLKRTDVALVSFDRAIALKPDHAEAHGNRGVTLKDLKRSDDALVSFDRAIALRPDNAEMHYNRGNALQNLKRHADALASFDRAIALKPDYAEAYGNRGLALLDLKRLDDALASCDKAIAIMPDLAAAHYNRGTALMDLKRPDAALASFDRAIALKPEWVDIDGIRLFCKFKLCDWTKIDAECSRLTSNLKGGSANIPPFAYLAFSSSSGDQLHYAKTWTAENHPPAKKAVWQGERYNHDRIRVAYVSADFRDHAVSVLTAGMFECHDRSRFEVTGISIGIDDKSEMRRRLMASFEHFIDARALSDEAVASRIREAEIELLIDLQGFTTDARTNIFARRPAPLQINYIGYPGTMGASYIDYIIADQTVIPEECRQFYSEKIVTLPNTYQANDRKRIISDKAFSRDELGLPTQGFVFCCFNNIHKIMPQIFDCWMRILKDVPGSVMWLLEDNATATNNLKRVAAARGVDQERIVFAKRMPPPEHLARYRHADLFLDTLPYNAHTTASDALWAGAPVLTRLGETFAGRVAASLLKAIDLPELITASLEEYEKTAIEIATEPERLAAIKRRLAENRLTTPLFDTKQFTGHIEAAYSAMHQRHQAGLAPDHLLIPKN